MAFYDNGKQIMRRQNSYEGTMCANPDLPHAKEACCVEDIVRDIREAHRVSNTTYLYEGERMKWDTAQARCSAYGKDLCVFESVVTFPSKSQTD